MNALLSRIKAVLNRVPFFGTVWFFPIIASCLLLLLTVFRVHGSSITVYDELLSSDDSSQTIFGAPRTVRSDEWYVNTPFVFSQVENDFPVKNTDVGSGQDMSVVVDVPYAEWSAFFKPQNLVFFILPLEYAFAFKWWFLLWLLFIATYALVLTISPKRYTRAALLAIFLCFSPFIQWWYQSITILPIAYIFLLVAIAVRTASLKNLRSKLWAGILLSYFASCFLLVMYPAFQIVCGIVGATIFVGITIDKGFFKKIFSSKAWIIYSLSIFATLLVGGSFILAHRDIITTISETVYPGSRDIHSGGTQVASLLNWPLGYLSLRTSEAAALGGNQSETSRFLFFGFLLSPLVAYHFMRRKNRSNELRHRTLSIALMLVTLLFIVRNLLPIGSGLYRLIGMHLVPHVRLIIGLGMINIILMAIILDLPTKSWRGLQSLVDKVAIIMATLSTTIILSSAYYVDSVYDIASVGLFEIIGVSVVGGIVVGLLAHRLQTLRNTGLLLAITLSFIISFPINPLSQGVGALKNSELAQYISKVERQNNSYWITSKDGILSPIMLASGAEVFSGVNTHPQLEVWQKYFPGEDTVFNRYAHINFSIEESANRSIKLLQADAFLITAESCDPMLNELDIDYIVTKEHMPNAFNCFKLSKTFIYNNTPINIFERTQNNH